MVILSAGLEPRHDAKETGKLFGLSCSSDGWFIERHPKLDPVATMTEGIFIAGACQGPKDIPASVVQGAAAAARVLGLIQRRQVSLEPIRATINPEKCSGCRICNNLCPFGAIAFLADRAISEVNPALCQGCGTCVAACPAQAIAGAHFSMDQIMSEIEGVLMLNLDQPAAVLA
jgi:heterodisulfide reductase subunit A